MSVHAHACMLQECASPCLHPSREPAPPPPATRAAPEPAQVQVTSFVPARKAGAGLSMAHLSAQVPVAPLPHPW